MTDPKKRPVSMVPLREFNDEDFNLDASKFKFDQVLGKGAFSTVYKALYDGVPVAVKKQTLVDEELEKYIRKELSILRRCKHKGLVKYVGSCKVDAKTVYIATEYCPGGDLRRLLQSSSPLGWRLRVSIAHGVAEGIAYLHARELIHRDIKTENILLDNEYRTKLCDFGFARGTERLPGRPMTMCGTDEFMAPEVIFGMDYDEKADIFGFGVVIAEIISREIPGKKGGFLERRPADGFTVNREELQEVLQQSDPPQSLSLLCEECLSDEAVDRPSAEECFHWLDDLLHELPEDTEKRPSMHEEKILAKTKEDLEKIEEGEDDDEGSYIRSSLGASKIQDKKERLRRATLLARDQYTQFAKPFPSDGITADDDNESIAESTASEEPMSLSRLSISSPSSPPPAPLSASRSPPPPSLQNKLDGMAGYVTKRGGRIKTWKKRFMVITSEGLVYFKTKEDFYKNPQVIQGSLTFDEICRPKGAFTVCEAVTFLQTRKQHSFRVMTNARPRYFSTADARLTNKWVRQINIAFASWVAANPTAAFGHISSKPLLKKSASFLKRSSKPA